MSLERGTKYYRVSAGMSRAFKARSRACPKCGKKTIQPRQRHYWQHAGHRCRWCGLGIRGADGRLLP